MTTLKIALQVLQEVKTILTEDTWTTHSLARNSYGHPCDALSTSAKCFCVAGAMDRAIFNLKLLNFAVTRMVTMEHLKKSAGINELLGQWNDHQPNFKAIEQVLDTSIDCAIKELAA